MAEESKKQTSALPPATAPTDPLYQDRYSTAPLGPTPGLEPGGPDRQATAPAAPSTPEIDVEQELATAWANLKRNVTVFLEVVGLLIARLIDVITWPFRIVYHALVHFFQLIWMVVSMVVRSLGRVLLFPFRPAFRFISFLSNPLAPDFEDEAIEGKTDEQMEEVPVTETQAPTKPARVSFLDLAERGIVFVDDKKLPLYKLDKLKGKKGYSVNVEVMDAAIISRILEQFKELAPRARALPPPQSGRFSGISMSDILEQAAEQDIRDFMYYVNTFPKKYIGKELKFAGSFAAWVSAGAPLE